MIVSIRSNDAVFLSYDEKVYCVSHKGEGQMSDIIHVELPEPIRMVCAGQNIMFAISYTSKVYAWKPFYPSIYVKLEGLFDSFEDSKCQETEEHLSEEEKFKRAV